MLVLDDLHGADVASLQLLKFVARVVHDVKIVLIGTYRDAEMHHSPERAAIIPDILRDAAQLPLAGLAENEVARMVEVRAQHSPNLNFVADLFRTTAGNPLFVDGIIRVLAAEGRLETALGLDVGSFKLPEGARGTIRKRLAMLSSDGRSILAIAATIGLEFELNLLARIGGDIAAQFLDQLREGIETGLITVITQECYRFTHPLIREVLYDELNAEGRSRLHLQIGESLESLPSADVALKFAQLAHHYRLGGNFEKAIDYSIAAGEEARAVFAHEETVRHWQLAIEMMQKMSYPAARQASLLEQLGYTEELAQSSLVTAVAHLVRAIKL
jgi:predicted ATPase